MDDECVLRPHHRPTGQSPACLGNKSRILEIALQLAWAMENKGGQCGIVLCHLDPPQILYRYSIFPSCRQVEHLSISSSALRRCPHRVLKEGGGILGWKSGRWMYHKAITTPSGSMDSVSRFLRISSVLRSLRNYPPHTGFARDSSITSLIPHDKLAPWTS